jgi:hypothetical protein
MLSHAGRAGRRLWSVTRSNFPRQHRAEKEIGEFGVGALLHEPRHA